MRIITAAGVMGSALICIVLTALVVGIISGAVSDRIVSGLMKELAEWAGTEEDGIPGFWRDQVIDIRSAYAKLEPDERQFLSLCDRDVSEAHPEVLQRLGYGWANYRGGHQSFGMLGLTLMGR